MAKGLGLGCCLGCCSPVGSAQHRPRREPRPARQSATGGQRSSARGFGVDVGKRTKERRRARCHPVPAASQKEGGAGLVLGGNYPSQNRRKRAENPRKSRKHIDLNRQRPYNKKCRGNPAGVCCRQAVSHSLTLHREGVMRMGHKGCGVRALRFVLCVVAALAVAIALAPKAC